MNCPQCGHRLSRVTVTRRSDTGVRRNRVCHAGHKFTTHELPTDSLNRFASFSAELACTIQAAMAVEQAGERSHG